jgi:TetR/AcrR family transcriptional regulator, cholesterol catabolism regulator
MMSASLLSISAADAPVGIDRREEILGVACYLFFSKGFGVASMRDIAEQIGFTQAAIYYHFRSKDEILFALIDDFTGKLHQLLDRVMHETGDPVRDLERAICEHILVSRTHYREIKLVIEDKKLLGPPFVERARQQELLIYDLYKSRIEQLVSAGRCAPIDPTVATFTVLASINFVYQWYRPDGALALGEIARQIVLMLTGGLIAHSAPAIPAPEETEPKARRKASARKSR